MGGIGFGLSTRCRRRIVLPCLRVLPVGTRGRRILRVLPMLYVWTIAGWRRGRGVVQQGERHGGDCEQTYSTHDRLVLIAHCGLDHDGRDHGGGSR